MEKCSKCNYDGHWKTPKSKYMICYRCGKQWIPQKSEKEKNEYISVIEKVYEKVEF
jgi:hypothetical protein